jgi:hypothetical protein
MLDVENIQTTGIAIGAHSTLQAPSFVALWIQKQQLGRAYGPCSIFVPVYHRDPIDGLFWNGCELQIRRLVG